MADPVKKEESLRPRDTEDIEVSTISQAIFEKYGYDFRRYSKASLKRRLINIADKQGFESISELQHGILRDSALFSRILADLTVTVTEFFRDGTLFRVIREKVAPHLHTYPQIKVWHAGCSSGEEVDSMAITLHEEGLLSRCLIYGTDINLAALRRARRGIYPLEAVRKATQNYFLGGGKESPSRYFTTKHGAALLNPFLRERVLFSDHNLATDTSFAEVQLLVCRNVLIYFDSELQERALELFALSLSAGGFLCLGSKESLQTSKASRWFETVDATERIYRKRIC